MWKERHGYYWAQTWLGATNATEGHPLGLTGQWVEDDQFNQDWRGFDSDPAGWASEEYQNCLDACETTCDELAETNPGEPGEFERLYDSAFLQREGYERSIADSGYETEFGIDDIGKQHKENERRDQSIGKMMVGGLIAGVVGGLVVHHADAGMQKRSPTTLN